MMQAVVNRRRGIVVLAVVALMVSVVWVGVASRASAASATPVVYVATGENFPDALGASSAAAVQGGPVLLVTKTSIPAETKAELARLSPDVIYVAGGTAVVSDTVLNALKAYAPTVIRLAGANRYATAAEVSESAFPITGGGGDTAALEAAVAALTIRLDTLETKVGKLESENSALKARFSGVYRDGDTLIFEGMNLRVVNGQKTTATTNGVGNLIIGYNEDTGLAEARTGSHYLIVGTNNDWTSYGGIVAGRSNTASGEYASVTGGSGNTADGLYASVSGGRLNDATGAYASVSGGQYNDATGDRSSVSGGEYNEASSYSASVSGGYDNTASAYTASVSGGEANTASGGSSSVSGGEYNEAEGLYTSILGGESITRSTDHAHYPS